MYSHKHQSDTPQRHPNFRNLHLILRDQPTRRIIRHKYTFWIREEGPEPQVRREECFCGLAAEGLRGGCGLFVAVLEDDGGYYGYCHGEVDGADTVSG